MIYIGSSEPDELQLSIQSYGHLLRIYVSSRKTEKTLVLQGWVAEKDMCDLQDVIENYPETVLVTSEPDEDIKNVPFVEARNPLKRSFQSIVGLYGLPASKEVDPTIFFIFTFSIFSRSEINSPAIMPDSKICTNSRCFS